MLDSEADTSTLGKTAGKDADNDKPTYVTLLGAQAAKKMADEFFAAFNAALTDPDLDTRGSVSDASGAQHPSPRSVPLAHGLRPASRPEAAPFAGGFKPELYRAFWFSFGAAFALLISRWIA